MPKNKVIHILYYILKVLIYIIIKEIVKTFGRLKNLSYITYIKHTKGKDFLKSTHKMNYWEERFNNLPNYIVVGRDMDGITGWTVIHKNDEREWQSGCYRSKIMNGLSMLKSEMQKLADEMNKLKK